LSRSKKSPFSNIHAGKQLSDGDYGQHRKLSIFPAFIEEHELNLEKAFQPRHLLSLVLTGFAIVRKENFLINPGKCCQM
jgi:hypothetical protein